MQGVVKERSQTDSGAKYITIDKQRYYFDREVNAFPEVGAKIDFEWHEFGQAKGNYGRPRSISSWKPVVNGATGKPETGSTISDADILRSVSNVVGSACTAGTVKSPEELEKWFVAAWAGFTRRTKASNGKADPEFNDDIPGFEESENPAPRTAAGSNW